MSARGDYLSCVSLFTADSVAARLDYERQFLDHRARLRAVQREGKGKIDTWNDKVYGNESEEGLRARLAHNRAAHLAKNERAHEVARANAQLVARLQAIADAPPSLLGSQPPRGGATSAPSHSNSSSAPSHTRARAAAPVAGAGSNDRVRLAELHRIEAENLALATRLLNNQRSPLSAEAFVQHESMHQHFLKNKSKLRFLRMKAATPGTATSAMAMVRGEVAGARGNASAAHRASAPNRARRPAAAVTGVEQQQQQQQHLSPQEQEEGDLQAQQAAEYEYAVEAFNYYMQQQQQQHQQQQTQQIPVPSGSAFGDGPTQAASTAAPISPAPVSFPPISLASTSSSFASPAQPRSLSARGPPPSRGHVHAPSHPPPRTSRGGPSRPRETPFRATPATSIRTQLHNRPKHLAHKFAQLDAETRPTVVPRTRLDPRTGEYKLEWVEVGPAAAEERDRSRGAHRRHPEEEKEADAAALAHRQHALYLYGAYLASASFPTTAASPSALADATSDDAHSPSAAPATECKEEPASAPRTFIPRPPSPAPEAAWPFAGSIVPPHLQPPAARALSSHPPSLESEGGKGGSVVVTPRSGAHGRGGQRIRATPVPASEAAASPRGSRTGKRVSSMRRASGTQQPLGQEHGADGDQAAVTIPKEGPPRRTSQVPSSSSSSQPTSPRASLAHSESHQPVKVGSVAPVTSSSAAAASASADAASSTPEVSRQSVQQMPPQTPPAADAQTQHEGGELDAKQQAEQDELHSSAEADATPQPDATSAALDATNGDTDSLPVDVAPTSHQDAPATAMIDGPSESGPTSTSLDAPIDAPAHANQTDVHRTEAMKTAAESDPDASGSAQISHAAEPLHDSNPALAPACRPSLDSTPDPSQPEEADELVQADVANPSATGEPTTVPADSPLADEAAAATTALLRAQGELLRRQSIDLNPRIDASATADPPVPTPHERDEHPVEASVSAPMPDAHASATAAAAAAAAEGHAGGMPLSNDASLAVKEEEAAEGGAQEGGARDERTEQEQAQ